MTKAKSWTNSPRLVLDFATINDKPRRIDHATNAQPHARNAGRCRNAWHHEFGAGADPFEGHGLPRPVQLFDLRRRAQKPVRETWSSGRGPEHAELRRAAQRPRQRRPSDRARGGRQRGGDGRACQGRRRDRDRRRQRLQPHLRPAGNQCVRRSARQNGRGGCPEHRLCTAPLQGAQGRRSQQGRLRRQAGRRHDGAARGHDQGRTRPTRQPPCSIRPIPSAPARPG